VIKRTLTASLTLAVFMPAAAHAQPPSPKLVRRYERTYHQVAAQLGRNAPGRDIAAYGLASGRRATANDIETSLVVLERMLAPSTTGAVRSSDQATPAGTTVTAPATTTSAPDQSYTASAPDQSYSGPSTSASVSGGGGLVGCIVERESSGNPNAAGGGLGQFQQSTWEADGGTQYAPTPNQASASQQLAVIQAQVAAGHTSQWTAYDGC